jgi:hypothetical protein
VVAMTRIEVSRREMSALIAASKDKPRPPDVRGLSFQWIGGVSTIHAESAPPWVFDLLKAMRK